ncbi:hypothetical protein Plhal304r1_c056g0142391 [Plasmopara halstedii]
MERSYGATMLMRAGTVRYAWSKKKDLQVKRALIEVSFSKTISMTKQTMCNGIRNAKASVLTKDSSHSYPPSIIHSSSRGTLHCFVQVVYVQGTIV